MSLVTTQPDRSVRMPDLKGVLLSSEFGLFLLIVLFGGLFYSVSSGFLSSFNIAAMSRAAAINIMIGFSMMAVIATGGLSLAVGAIGACAAMTCGWLLQEIGLPWPLALLLAIAVGAALGAINGVIEVKTGLHSFIVTLATMSLFFGIMIFLTQAQTYRGIPADFVSFGRMKVMGISAAMGPTLIVTAALIVLYGNTRIGKEMLAAGARPEAARLSGVRVGRMIVLAHAISGGLAAIAALLLVARNGAAIPSMAGNLGQDWLLIAFLGPVLGGAVLTGGKISVIGAFLGAVLVTVLSNGLLLMQIGEFWLQACLGAVLLLAVLLDLARRNYLERRAKQ
ncbi:ABC transporter permease [Shimia biformata]|uniref:ABC transporter permease n=1 Tax=Shimia biformata TaxID=1294299 RepID=UPI00194E2A74|nr:ABC transporter permease [Shimia biformata]